MLLNLPILKAANCYVPLVSEKEKEMIIFSNNKKYSEFSFKLEKDFENEISNNSKLFFGPKTIYIDFKRKIDSQTFGGAIPDGFLFDFSDPSTPEFYLIEVELTSHDFFKHIFPQITKFFAFFNNEKSRRDLISKLYSIISQNNEIEQEFRKYLNNKEIFKFLNDIIEDSQNILLILDGEKIELPEIIETYTDTWGKIVKIQIIKKFINSDSSLYIVSPEFENIDFIDTFAESTESENVQSNKITEEYHLETIEPEILKIYNEIKNRIQGHNNKIYLNPQKYYISIRLNHNLAFFKIRKKKLRLIVMLPENTIKGKINSYNIKSLTESVQKFYNGPCAAIDIDKINNIDEIIDLLKIVIDNDTNIA